MKQVIGARRSRQFESVEAGILAFTGTRLDPPARRQAVDLLDDGVRVDPKVPV